MSPELEVQIRARWPGWFGRHRDSSKSLMGVGFQHGDGWYGLLVKTLERIEPHVTAFNVELANIGEQFEVMAVKQEFGELQIIALPATTGIILDFMDARYESVTICELCGAPGELRTEGYTQTLCFRCAGERESRG